MVGSEGLKRLQAATVTVVGLGAVGGYAVEALARSGIGHLRLIDYDIIKPSNINRQILALWSNIGQKKCTLAAERVLAINPHCRAEPLDLFVHTDTLDIVLGGSPESRTRQTDPGIVVDAIDSLNPKVELISALATRSLPAVSSMGAALRTDPTRLRIGPLAEITHCRLAMMLRKRLRRRGITPIHPCVYSPEPVRELQKKAILPPELSEENYYNQGRRRSSLGSLPTLTGIFGLAVANTVLTMILER